MKTLILSVTAGFGHHATAKALEQELTERGSEVRVVDVYRYINTLMYKTIDKGYLFSSKHAQAIYRYVYTHLEDKDGPDSRLNPMTLVNMLCALKFEKFIERNEPDVIVCTHVFAALIIDELKRRGKIRVPTIGIVTDFTIHPYWEDAANLDYVVTASEYMTHRAISRGIKKENIRPLGIPIHPKFDGGIPRAEARQKLGLNTELPVILLMGGSMGYGHMNDTVKRLAELDVNIQVLAVCGNSKKQRKFIEEFKEEHPEFGKNLHIFGFVDYIELMMDAADCIVTKPGGLTISEALSKQLPIIMLDPMPGHEERNAEFLLNTGCAMFANESFAVDDAVYFLFSDKMRLRTMRESVAATGKPHATRDLADFITELSAR
ncbi:UDP-glucuronosyltransferase [Clostridia bacterium]|nr:UDP-glucuronosyltransferase [Clostridia bacterium]